MDNLFFQGYKFWERKDVELRYVCIRFFVITVALFLIFFSDYYLNIIPYYLVLVLALVYNFYMWFVLNLKGEINSLIRISLYIDITIITILVIIRGGLRSDFFVAYFIALGYAAMKEKTRTLIFISMYTVLLYSLSCWFFSNSFNSGRLIIRISYILIITIITRDIARNLSYAKMVGKKATELALIDPLTGVYNRYILNSIRDILETGGSRFTIAMLDVDNLKVLNDTYGHGQGDLALKELGMVIYNTLDKDDICIRYGGDEFIIIFRGIGKEEALSKLKIISEKMKNRPLYMGKEEVVLSFSAGLVECENNEGIKKAINQVDKLLYQAKRDGKDRICLNQ